MTPRELYIAGEANNEKTLEEVAIKKRLIYTQAVLNRAMIWAKKQTPPYEKFFKEPKKAMTDEQMLKMVEALNKMFGGEDKRGRVT